MGHWDFLNFTCYMGTPVKGLHMGVSDLLCLQAEYVLWDNILIWMWKNRSLMAWRGMIG